MTMVAFDYRREHADPDCIDPGDAAELLRGAPWRRLAVLGDSVAAGIREPLAGYRDYSFADRVADAIGATKAAFQFRNFAARDLKLADIAGEPLALALEFEPDLAILTGGGNDALARDYDPERVRSQLSDIVSALSGTALVVTIGLFDLARSGLLPRALQPLMIERFDELDRITSEVVAEVGGIHVDTHHHPRAADPAIFSRDRLHANTRGHAIAASEIERALSERARMPVARR